jgi:hypothetical protein
MRLPALLGLLVAGVAHADTSLSSPGAWIEGRAALARLRPWARCKEIAELLAKDPEELYPKISVRAVPGGLDVTLYQAGSGRWATAGEETLRLRSGSCYADGAKEEGGKESLISGLRRSAIGAAKPPTLAELAQRDGAVLVDSPDGGEIAAARMLVHLARDDAGEPFDSLESGGAWCPSLPIQPEQRGLPHGSPAALWTPQALAAAGVRDPWLLQNEDGERFDAIHTWTVRAPRPFASHGRWQLWELRFRARLGGGLLAVYDRTRDRHRWIWGSEYDQGVGRRWPFEHGALYSGHFDVLSVEDDLLLLVNHFDGRAYLWAIDLVTGEARRAAAGGRVTFRKVDGGVEAKGADGSRRVLSIAELRRHPG